MRIAHDLTAHNRLVAIVDLEPDEIADHGLPFAPVMVYIRIRWEDGGASPDVVASVYGRARYESFGQPGSPIPAWIQALIKEVQ